MSLKIFSLCFIVSLISPLCLAQSYIGSPNANQLPCTTAEMVRLINQFRTNYTYAINLVNSRYPLSDYPQTPLTTEYSKLYLVQTLRDSIETLVKTGSLNPVESFDAHNAFSGMQAHRNTYYGYTTHFGCCIQPISQRLAPFGLGGRWAEGIWNGITPFRCEDPMLGLMMSDLGHRGPFLNDHSYVGIGFGASRYTPDRDGVTVVVGWWRMNASYINSTYVNLPEVRNWLNHYAQNVSCPADQTWPGLHGIQNPNSCDSNYKATDSIFLSDGTCYGDLRYQVTTNVSALRTAANTSSTLNLLKSLKAKYPTIWGSADPAQSTLLNFTNLDLNVTLSQHACRFAKAKLTDTPLLTPLSVPNGSLVTTFEVFSLEARTNQELQILAILQGGKFFLNYQSYGYGVYYNSTTAVVVSVLYSPDQNLVNPPAPSPSAAKQPVFRFFSSATRQMYLTTISSLANATSLGFPSFTKIAFYTFVDPLPGTSPLSRFRLGADQGRGYMYTATDVQNISLVSDGWQFDGILGYVYTGALAGLNPIFLYNSPNLGARTLSCEAIAENTYPYAYPLSSILAYGVLSADPNLQSDATCYGAFQSQVTANVSNLRTTANTTTTLTLLNSLKAKYPTIWGSADPAQSTFANFAALPLNVTLSQYACQYARARATNTPLPSMPPGTNENYTISEITSLSAATNQELQILAILQGGKFFLNYESYGYGVYYNSTTAVVVSVLYSANAHLVNPPTPSPSAAKQPVFRFFSSATKQMYLTLNSSLANAVNFGFPSFTKIGFYTFVDPLPGTTPLSRFRSGANLGRSYMYGVTAAQNASLPKDGWNFDGILGYVYTGALAGLSPIFLYESPNLGAKTLSCEALTENTYPYAYPSISLLAYGMLSADPNLQSDATCYGAFQSQVTANVSTLRTTANTTTTLTLLNSLKAKYPTIWGSADPAQSTFANFAALPLNVALSQYACQYARARATNTPLPSMPPGTNENYTISEITSLSAATNQELQILAILQGGKFFLNYESYGYGVYYTSTTAVVVSVLYSANAHLVNPPTPSPSAVKQPVFRFFNSATRQMYLTLNSSLANAVSLGFPSFTKVSFSTFVDPLPGTTPLSRFRSGTELGRSYVYTVTAAQNATTTGSWKFDGILGYVYTGALAGLSPINQYSSPRIGAWTLSCEPLNEYTYPYGYPTVTLFAYGIKSGTITTATA